MQPSISSLPTRIAAKISADAESGCWVWTAGLYPKGYGAVRWAGDMRYAHRIVYQILVGDPGLILDHRCFNHACVNPEHLRPVTAKQNQEHRRGATDRSKSGVRGVSWDKSTRKWRVTAGHNGEKHYGGCFTNLAEAEQAAIALRARLFTHDDGKMI